MLLYGGKVQSWLFHYIIEIQFLQFPFIFCWMLMYFELVLCQLKNWCQITCMHNTVYSINFFPWWIRVDVLYPWCPSWIGHKITLIRQSNPSNYVICPFNCQTFMAVSLKLIDQTTGLFVREFCAYPLQAPDLRHKRNFHIRKL